MRKFAMLLVLWAAAILPAQAQLNGLSAELNLDQSQYLPDEDVQLSVRIANRSGQPIVLGADNTWISFQILGEHEYVVPKLGEMPAKAPITLLPGQEVTRVFNPTPYFDFRRQGRYTIGVNIKIAQWKQQIACKPVAFIIAEGMPLLNLDNLSFGVPTPGGVTNAVPETRQYGLLKITGLDRITLYFRLTDFSGRTLRVFPLGGMVSFGAPDAQLDRANNLHVLFQSGARTFTYCAINPNGVLLARQFHEYAQKRPSLRMGDDGLIVVGGGRRRLTMNDFPAPETGTAGNP